MSTIDRILYVHRPFDGDFSNDDVIERALGDQFSHCGSGAGFGQRDLEFTSKMALDQAAINAVQTMLREKVSPEITVDYDEWQEDLEEPLVTLAAEEV